jgi:hypothetical protein
MHELKTNNNILKSNHVPYTGMEAGNLKRAFALNLKDLK